MNYEWDEKKRAVNLEKHGLDFLDAIALLEGTELLIVCDDRKTTVRNDGLPMVVYMAGFMP